MAISSPQVTQRQQPDLLQMGMQIGQQLQIQKQMGQQEALNTFKMLDTIAKDPSMAGGWNALLKRPGVEETLKGAFGKLGVSEQAATELMTNLGTSIPSIEASMQMVQGVETYLAKGEAPPPQFYQSFQTTPPKPPGEQPAQPATGTQEITGTTYKWQEAAQSQQPMQQQQPAGTPEQLRTAGEQLKTATNQFERELQQFGWTPAKGPTKEQLIESGNVPEGLKPALQKVQSAQQQMDTLMGEKAVDITSGQQTNSPQQQKNVVDGNWVVKEKNAVVGTVQDGVFRPNQEYKWTNEKEMIEGMSSQMWGKEKGDVEAFREMLYSQAKEAGYKGSKEKFFYAKSNEKGMGRPSSHGAWMPEWYDFARENGIAIKQPSETSTPEMLQYTQATGKAKISAIERTEERIRKTLSPEGLETTITAQAFPESGAGGAVTKEERVPGYLTFEEAKKNEKFLKQHLGHYGDLLFKDKKTYNEMMLQQKRIYNNLGGEAIMETLAPNKMDLEKAKLGAIIDQEINRMLYADKELQAQMGWKAKDFELREKQLNLQERMANAEMGLKWNLAQQKAGEKANDVTQQMFDEGHKTLSLYKDRLGEEADIYELYKNDPVFRYGYTQILMAGALRSGINPKDIPEAIAFQTPGEEGGGGLLGTVGDFFGGIGEWFTGAPEEPAIPVLGPTEQIRPETEAEKSLRVQKEEAETKNKADIEALPQEWLQ